MTRVEVEWASFGPGVRINGSASEAPAIAKSGSTNLFKDMIHGEPCLVVEDASLRATVYVPWHNVGSVVFVKPALVVAPVEKKDGRFTAKPKLEEPAA